MTWGSDDGNISPASDAVPSEPEDEAHELVGGSDNEAPGSPSAEKVVREPPRAPPPEKKGKKKALAKLPPDAILVHYNRQYWLVKEDDKERDYKRMYVCESGERLGQMIESKKKEDWPEIHSGESKPGPGQLGPAQVVVLKGRCNKEDDDKTSYGWYLRCSVKDADGMDDGYILRHIPKDVYKNCIRKWSQVEPMKRSSLITTHLAAKDNDKPFDPRINDWEKWEGEPVKTGLVAPPKRTKETKEKEKEPAEAAPETAPEAAPEAVEEAPAPEPERKVPKPRNNPKPAATGKQSVMSSFARADGGASSSASGEDDHKRSLSDTVETTHYKLGKSRKLVHTATVPDNATSAKVSVTYQY